MTVATPPLARARRTDVSPVALWGHPAPATGALPATGSPIRAVRWPGAPVQCSGAPVGWPLEAPSRADRLAADTSRSATARRAASRPVTRARPSGRSSARPSSPLPAGPSSPSPARLLSPLQLLFLSLAPFAPQPVLLSLAEGPATHDRPSTPRPGPDALLRPPVRRRSGVAAVRWPGAPVQRGGAPAGWPVPTIRADMARGTLRAEVMELVVAARTPLPASAGRPPAAVPAAPSRARTATGSRLGSAVRNACRRLGSWGSGPDGAWLAWNRPVALPGTVVEQPAAPVQQPARPVNQRQLPRSEWWVPRSAAGPVSPSVHRTAPPVAALAPAPVPVRTSTPIATSTPSGTGTLLGRRPHRPRAAGSVRAAVPAPPSEEVARAQRVGR